MLNERDEVVTISNHSSLQIRIKKCNGVKGIGVPRLVSVKVLELVDWDFISDVMKFAAVDNEVGSFPSYHYPHNSCEFTFNRFTFSEELVF
jgi:hypothetical protein